MAIIMSRRRATILMVTERGVIAVLERNPTQLEAMLAISIPMAMP